MILLSHFFASIFHRIANKLHPSTRSFVVSAFRMRARNNTHTVNRRRLRLSRQALSCYRIRKAVQGGWNGSSCQSAERTSVMAQLSFTFSTIRLCSIAHCQNKHVARGFCRKHYLRWWKHSDPLKTLTAPNTPTGIGLAFLKALLNTSETCCIKWPYGNYTNGYGHIKFRGQQMSASRAMCILSHGGPDNSSLESSHSCGNGHLGCVQPSHLRWATHTENMHDSILHGTFARGSGNGYSKLTEEQVIQIRQQYETGDFTYKTLGERYSVSISVIGNIINRVTWKHL